MALLTGTNTDATTPYVITGTNEDTGTEGWRAFDGSKAAGNGYYTTNTAGNKTLKIDFGNGNAKLAIKYILYAVLDNSFDSPADFTVDGSNNDTDWTTLDTKTGVALTDSGEGNSLSVTFSNTTAYRYYRILVTATKNARNYCSIGEFELYSADAGGNLDLTSKIW